MESELERFHTADATAAAAGTAEIETRRNFLNLNGGEKFS